MLVLIGAALVAVPIDRALQARRSRQQLVAVTDPYMSLGQALTGLPKPVGFTAASTNADTRAAIVLGFHWQGHDIGAHQAAAEFEQALASIHAEHPIARCSTAATAVLCRVDATLAGRSFAVFISEKPHYPTSATVFPQSYFPPSGGWLKDRPF